MCGLLALLKSAAMPQATDEHHASAPKSFEAAVDNDTTTDYKLPLRTTKDPNYMFKAILSGLDQHIRDETSNPRRRENIRLCRDFVAEYGFPEEDHHIWVKDGVIRVLTEECMRLPSSPGNVDNFWLCAPEWEVY